MADKKKSHQNVGRRMKNVEGDGAPLFSSRSLPSGDREKLSREEIKGRFLHLNPSCDNTSELQKMNSATSFEIFINLNSWLAR